MEEQNLTLILLALCVLALLVALAWILAGERRQRRTLADFASQAGLVLSSRGHLALPVIVGVYRQRPVRMYAYYGEDGAIYTEMAIKNPGQVFFTLRRKWPLFWLFRKSTVLLATGDPVFDQKFCIECSSAQFAQRLLCENSALRSELLCSPVMNLSLGSDGLQHRSVRIEKNMRQIQALFDCLADVVSAMEDVTHQNLTQTEIVTQVTRYEQDEQLPYRHTMILMAVVFLVAILGVLVLLAFVLSPP